MKHFNTGTLLIAPNTLLILSSKHSFPWKQVRERNTSWRAVITYSWQMKQRSSKPAKEWLPIIQQVKTSRTKSSVWQEENLSLLLLSPWDLFSRPLFGTCFLEQHLFLEGDCSLSSVLGSCINGMNEWLLFWAKEKLQNNKHQTSIWSKDSPPSCCCCS